MSEEIRQALIRVLPFAIIIFILFVATQKRKISKADLCIQKPNSINCFLIWTIGFLFFVLLTEFVLYRLEILQTDRWNHALYPSIIRITGAVILAPVAEELIFRGLILSKLMKKGLNVHFAILIQSCFFVLLHNFTWQNTLSSNMGIVQGLIDASLFAYARHYTKSIYTPITMHITGNLVATMERFVL